MTNRLLAILGSIAHGIRQFFASILSLVGLGALARWAVPALVALLAIAALISARDTAAILASRPDVQQTTLEEVAALEDPSGSIWFEFDARMAESHFASPTQAGIFFYLARDPEDPGTGLLVRSPLNDAFIRQRVITADLIEDPAVVEAARAALPDLESGFDLDTMRYLDEVGAGGDVEAAFAPSELGEEEAGSQFLVHGRVLTPATDSVCAADDGCEGEDAAWYYYFADPQGGDVLVLRSPHPPDSIPVHLQGLFLRDTFDLAPVLESDWYAGLETSVPTDRALAAGQRPPITVPASWIPTILFAGLGLLLLASYLVGYPVFRGRPVASAAGRGMAPGEAIDLEITGRLAREHSTLALDRSPGAIERLTIPELALRMWRYGLLPRDLSRRDAEERFVAESAGESDRLVVHERDQSALVLVARDAGAVRVESGRVHRVSRSAPGVRLRQDRTDAYLTFRDEAARDRAAAEIRAEAGGSAST